MKTKNIVLIITGGVAAYKAADLASKLTKAGYRVKPVLTTAAQQFISGLTLHSLCGLTPGSDMFAESSYIEHITLAEWADLIVVAPATADFIARAANGLGNDLATSILLAATCPVLFVPAMNVNMYANTLVQDNINRLLDHGKRLLVPESGLMACGTTGPGRYPNNTEVVYAVQSVLSYPKADFAGKNVLVTAGACREQLDPMRYLSNNSSGKTGLAIARAFALRGASVSLVHAHIQGQVPHYVKGYYALSAQQMHQQVTALAPDSDIIVMSAAVSDYTFASISDEKIKKGGEFTLSLVPTVDILAQLGKAKKSGQILVGFAAETNSIEENARKKLAAKNLDLIVANHLEVAGKAETSQVIIGHKTYKQVSGDKFTTANHLLDTINEL